MKKWEDTVMSFERMKDEIWAMGCKAEDEGIEITNKLRFEIIAQAQAEKSFDMGKAEGRREVVEFIERHINENVYDEHRGEYTIDPEDLEDQKKEWGI